MRTRIWPLSPEDSFSVSDEDAFDFAELLEIALTELPEANVAHDLVRDEFRGDARDTFQELIAFCRQGRFTVERRAKYP